MKSFSLSLIAVLFIFSAQNALAHSGHKKESTPITATEEPTSIDPMYANEEKASDPFGDSGLFSPSDLFIPGEVVEPTQKTEMKMEGSHKESDDHNMPKVESAKHKTVCTSSKGYGVAAGITFLAGLVFAGLTFIKPRE